jgi:hypothetical protein
MESAKGTREGRRASSLYTLGDWIGWLCFVAAAIGVLTGVGFSEFAHGHTSGFLLLGLAAGLFALSVLIAIGLVWDRVRGDD